MAPQIIANIRFYRTNEGGRKGPIVPPHFSCVFEIGDRSHDCRLLLQSARPIEPGQTATLAIQFLFPDLVLPKLFVGQKFFLWQGGHIAEGEVVEIVQ